jgi:hypothetical protein
VPPDASIVPTVSEPVPPARIVTSPPARRWRRRHRASRDSRSRCCRCR